MLLDTVTIQEQVIRPSEYFVNEANIKNSHLYEIAKGNRIAFWEGCASQLDWFKKWHTVLEWDSPYAKWFEGGKLNVSYNCLDRFMKTPVKEKVALHFISENGTQESWTYEKLYLEVNKLASGLKSLGIKKGDCVGIYLPNCPEAVATMLACARIGAVHTVVFAGFSSESLRNRLIDANAKVLVTSDVSYRRGKVINLHSVAEEAVKGLTCIEKMVVVQRQGKKPSLVQGRDVFYHDLIKNQPEYCPPEKMESEDVLFILYTSGTTGKPKGVIHTTGGYLVGANITTKLVFDIKPQDVFWCTADIGWITGHTYIVYGPLSNGMTVVLYEGAPDYPNESQYWDIVEKYKVSILYTAPTAIRLFMKWGKEPLVNKDLSSLRLLGSVGEPLNPEAWKWYYENIGKSRCPIVDTWWQTETGSIMISTIPSVLPMKPGSVSKPLPGVEIKILDEYGQEASEGYLAIMSPWPSMIRGIQGSARRYMESYWNKWGGRYYFSGDGAQTDGDGYFWISGRVDDTVNVSAHRIGTMEVESVLIEHPAIAEAAVIGVPDPLTGQALAAFITLKNNVKIDHEILEEALMELVKQKIGSFAKPKFIRVVQELPKTRSGKIMRRLLRDLIVGKELGDTTTLENVHLIETLSEKIQSINK